MFLASGETPYIDDSADNPWSASYKMGMGNLAADFRSNISAESGAKKVYENLIKFTDDFYVKESLQFLMRREMVHFQRFHEALNSSLPDEELPSMRMRFYMYGKLTSC